MRQLTNGHAAVGARTALLPQLFGVREAFRFAIGYFDRKKIIDDCALREDTPQRRRIFNVLGQILDGGMHDVLQERRLRVEPLLTNAVLPLVHRQVAAVGPARQYGRRDHWVEADDGE